MKSKTSIGHFLLLAAAIVWGFAFVAQRQGMAFMQPLTFNGVRFLLGAISLIPLFFLLKPAITHKTPVRKGLLMGILAGVPLFSPVLFSSWVFFIPVPEMQALLPVCISFFCSAFFALAGRKRAGKQTWTGIILATIGLYFFCPPIRVSRCRQAIYWF